MNTSRFLGAAILATAALWCSEATASPTFALFNRAEDCARDSENRLVLPQTVIVDRVLRDVGFSELSLIGAAGSIGTMYKAAAIDDCGNDQGCSAAQARMSPATRRILNTTLYNRLRPFLSSAPSDADFAVIRTGSADTSSAEAIVDSMALLLNGRASWFRVECRGTRPTDSMSAEQRRQAQERGNNSGGNEWIVGQNRTELRDAFADREFASVSYSDDDEKGGETLAIEGAIGRRLGDHTLAYVSANYSRTHAGADETLGVDNIDFGVSRLIRLPRNDLSLTARWETDHEFDSSMGAAEITWSPLYRFLPCLGRFEDPEENRLICDYQLVMDYADIAEPGGKGSLADVGEYWRAGIDLTADYYQPLGANRGFLQWSAGYQRREAIDGDDGQAESMRFGISFLPGRESQFSIGFSYVRGEDVSSLEPQDLFKIKLGYRR